MLSKFCDVKFQLVNKSKMQYYWSTPRSNLIGPFKQSTRSDWFIQMMHISSGGMPISIQIYNNKISLSIEISPNFTKYSPINKQYKIHCRKTILTLSIQTVTSLHPCAFSYPKVCQKHTTNCSYISFRKISSTTTIGWFRK